MYNQQFRVSWLYSPWLMLRSAQSVTKNKKRLMHLENTELQQLNIWQVILKCTKQQYLYIRPVILKCTGKGRIYSLQCIKVEHKGICCKDGKDQLLALKESTFGRVYTVQPINSECYYLRHMLTQLSIHDATVLKNDDKCLNAIWNKIYMLNVAMIKSILLSKTTFYRSIKCSEKEHYCVKALPPYRCELDLCMYIFLP